MYTCNVPTIHWGAKKKDDSIELINIAYTILVDDRK